MKEKVVKKFENGDILAKIDGGGYKYYTKDIEVPIEIPDPNSITFDKKINK